MCSASWPFSNKKRSRRRKRKLCAWEQPFWLIIQNWYNENGVKRSVQIGDHFITNAGIVKTKIQADNDPKSSFLIVFVLNSVSLSLPFSPPFVPIETNDMTYNSPGGAIDEAAQTCMFLAKQKEMHPILISKWWSTSHFSLCLFCFTFFFFLLLFFVWTTFPQQLGWRLSILWQLKTPRSSLMLLGWQL